MPPSDPPDATSAPSGTPAAASGGRPDPLPLAWRIAIVWAAAVLIWLCISQLASLLFGADYDRTGHAARAVLATLLAVPMVVTAHRLLDRTPWTSLGVPPLRTGWRHVLLGAGSYLAPAAVGFGVVLTAGATELTLDTSGGALIARIATLVALVLLYEALPEELIFRGYLYGNLATAMPAWLAVLTQALLFTLWGALITAATNAEQLALWFIAALVIGIIRALTGTVWATIGFHWAFQVVQQLFSPIGGQFTASHPEPLEGIAFGLAPFTLAPLMLAVLAKRARQRRRRPLAGA